MSDSESHQEPTAVQPSKKRTRAISTLTEEQRRQKREVDRRAQRAFRQRTKDCISNLEQQHLQLQESSRETESQLRRELQILHDQNQKLVRCLSAIVDAASAASHEHIANPVVTDSIGMHFSCDFF